MKTLRLLLLLSFLLSFALLATCGGSDDDKNASLPDADGPSNSSDDDADDDASPGDDDTTDDDDSSPESIPVALIHNDASVVSGYTAALDDYKIGITAIAESDVPTADLTPYDVLLVDTSCQWYLNQAVTAVSDSGLPIVGFYEGGGYLFDALALYAGWANGYTEFDITDATVANGGHAVFTKPYALSVQTGDKIALFTGNGVRLRYKDAIDAPSNVTLLAERPTQTDYSAITLQNSRFIYWGYEADPTGFTESGAKLLANCLHYLAGL